MRPEFIRWLLIHASRSETTGGGLRLRGVKIAGDMVLDGLKLDFPVLLSACAIDKVRLVDAGLSTLDLDGSHCKGIDGGRVSVDRGLLLGGGFRCDGRVYLPDASIQGDLNCDHGSFCNGDRVAFVIDGARIGGRVFLRDGRFEGAVTAINTRVEGGISASDAVFDHPEQVAVDFERVRASGFISLANAQVRGRVRMPGAATGSELSLRGLSVSEAGSDEALDLDRCTVGGRVVLIGAQCSGPVVMRNADVAKTLECTGAQFDGLGDHALTAAGASIGGRMVLREGFRSKGRVTLTGATIRGDISMDAGSEIVADGSPGLQLNRTHAQGNVELNGRILGRPAVNLAGTEIGGDLDLRGGRFETDASPPPGYKRPLCIRAEGLSVDGTLRGEELSVVNGEVRLPRSTVAGDVDLTRAKLDRRLVLGAAHIGGRLLLEDTELRGFSMVSGTVEGRFRWKPTDAESEQVELSHTTVGYLDDTGAKWPSAGLSLDGFAYGDSLHSDRLKAGLIGSGPRPGSRIRRSLMNS